MRDSPLPATTVEPSETTALQNRVLLDDDRASFYWEALLGSKTRSLLAILVLVFGVVGGIFSYKIAEGLTPVAVAAVALALLLLISLEGFRNAKRAWLTENSNLRTRLSANTASAVELARTRTKLEGYESQYGEKAVERRYRAVLAALNDCCTDAEMLVDADRKHAGYSGSPHGWYKKTRSFFSHALNQEALDTFNKKTELDHSGQWVDRVSQMAHNIRKAMPELKASDIREAVDPEMRWRLLPDD